LLSFQQVTKIELYFGSNASKQYERVKLPKSHYFFSFQKALDNKESYIYDLLVESVLLLPETVCLALGNVGSELSSATLQQEKYT
jgi:hypothetical protein